ncbi:NAD-dependent epimerase/dehydratase family protein [Rhodococcus sp. H29-C3]|uniref:NAD-dependent epimerase/dehydratase family protein n=1 Tax=Rhodococcus sp. H29-C3 TaxID=3046307 RepID=UPI0024BA3456|nr:NAD-dependent epimerase/dehydratase family protein [Rhodococcus sp. H29-C3]MDJ0362321.1 NAD-dependent epimerase/dehydratase family protein [Rhodococcus sp. H29-C3]
MGANGFLGAAIVDRFLDLGSEVRAFDRYSTAPRHRVTGKVTLFQGDLLSRTSLTAAITDTQDVFHFLSLTNPRISADNPLHDITTNLTSGVELFSMCASKNVERVFFASSGGTVYGDTPPPHHEDSPRNPTSPYGIGKVALENYLQYFAVENGLRSVSLRISNPYGPQQKPRSAQGIIPIALRAARDGKQLAQFGDGSMTRDYIYIPDLIEMIVKVARAPQHSTYNLGSGIGTALSSVMEAVERATDMRLQRKVVSYPPSFVQTSVLDIGRFVEQFGRPDLTSLEDGIAQTWQYIRTE